MNSHLASALTAPEQWSILREILMVPQTRRTEYQKRTADIMEDALENSCTDEQWEFVEQQSAHLNSSHWVFNCFAKTFDALRGSAPSQLS